MNRKEFIEKIEKNEVVFAIDTQKAGLLVSEGIVGKVEYYALHFWSTISLILHILAPLSLFWVKWYWAIAIFIVARILWKSTKQSNKDFVLEKALENDEFFNLCLENKILVIKSH
jgi:hypothetical protein